MAVRFAKAARDHHLGRAHVLYLMEHGEAEAVTTNRGEPAWQWIGPDDRGIELWVIAAKLEGGDLLVIHAQPVYEQWEE